MNDVEYLPISFLSQIGYCERRVGLLMNERLWAESTDTAKGRAEHERVHTQRTEKRNEVVKLFEYTVFSDKMVLLGKCDCIEATFDEGGCKIPAVDFPVRLYPVEYKHGSVRDEEEYMVQLCAQAICLEEMFNTSIPAGALFFTSSHRRLEVKLNAELRAKTGELAKKLHQIRESLCVPQAQYGAKCHRCSLKEMCMPRVKDSAHQYLRQLEKEAIKIVEDDTK